MELDNYLRYSRVARGFEKADLVFKNVNVVNVFTEEIIHGDVAVVNGLIVGVGEYNGVQEIDMDGKYICPGFIDCHLHLESTLVTPAESIHQAAQCGTTSFIVDPHEAANVAGSAGIDYILEQTEKVPANVFVMLPSCVPATDIDDNGCILSAEKMMLYLDNPRILGLGEVMDYPSVINGVASMHQKLELFRNKIIDGHAPNLKPGELSAYVLSGISTDHECVDFNYAMEERRRGMTVLIREGSAAKNLNNIVEGIVKHKIDTTGFCFCTDDKHIEEIRKEGHINFNVKKAVSLGVNVIKAIKMATIQAALCYGLKGLGAIAPGYQADIVVFDDLDHMNIQCVYHKGILIQKDIKLKINPCSPVLRNTVHLENFSKTQLALKNEKGPFHVIKMFDGQIITKDILVDISNDEWFIADSTYKKIAAIERHKNTLKVGVGIVAGFGVQNGAIASTVSHDSHNIIVIGDNDEDMEIAVNEIIRAQGGYTIVENGEVVQTLELPIMGLISDAGYETVNRILSQMIEKAHEMGIPEGMEPFISLSFLALPVIPEIRITPRGLYSVTENRFI